MNLRNRTSLVFVLACLILSLGAWLRWYASDPAFFQRMDADGGPTISDERLTAVAEIARVFLFSGASLLTLSAGAWLFVPILRVAESRESETGSLPASRTAI